MSRTNDAGLALAWLLREVEKHVPSDEVPDSFNDAVRRARLVVLAQARTAVPEIEKLREAIGTGEAGKGLPHWHHASGGTSGDLANNDRAGVFVDRQAVLDLIERVLR